MAQTTRRVDSMMTISEPLPDGKTIGAQCENGHRNLEVAIGHGAREGDRLECKECGAPITQTLIDEN